jgi:hypothetical protein
MYDRPTNSLWNNLTGEPVSGRLAESGIELERLPLVVTTWGEWKKEHPETLVLDPTKTGFARPYDESPYASYFASPDTMFPVWLRNDRLETKEIVFALIVNGQPKAYPIEVLKKEPVVHDEIRGKPVLLLTNPRSGAVRAYETRGKRFEPEGDALKDVSSGDRFRIDEDFLTSPSGETLPRIAGHNAYWFGWFAFYPTTEIYGQ